MNVHIPSSGVNNMAGKHHDAGTTRLACAAICSVLLVLWAPGHPHAAGAAPGPLVGVVDFYALSPLEGFSTMVPERFTADDLSAMLARGGAGRIAVIPRADVEKAERALGWQDADVLKYARLRDLAHQVNAGRLVVGWIKSLRVSHGGGPDLMEHGNTGGAEASTILQIQVFDASQGRIVSGMQFEGDARGLVAYLTAEEALHRALGPAVGPTLAALTGGER